MPRTLTDQHSHKNSDRPEFGLAFTGKNVGNLLTTGLASIAFGAGLILVTRRRRKVR